MYMTFCYHQALKVIFISAENAFTLAEWLLVIIPCTQSLISMRLSMLSLNFSASHCLLNVTSGVAWTTKGIGCFNPTIINATIPLYKFLSSFIPTYSPDWYCADWSSVFNAFNESTLPWISFNNDKGDIVNSSKITCSLGVMYNINVRHTKSLMLNKVVSLAVYKSFFD